MLCHKRIALDSCSTRGQGRSLRKAGLTPLLGATKCRRLSISGCSISGLACVPCLARLDTVGYGLWQKARVRRLWNAVEAPLPPRKPPQPTAHSSQGGPDGLRQETCTLLLCPKKARCSHNRPGYLNGASCTDTLGLTLMDVTRTVLHARTGAQVRRSEEGWCKAQYMPKGLKVGVVF